MKKVLLIILFLSASIITYAQFNYHASTFSNTDVDKKYTANTWFKFVKQENIVLEDLYNNSTSNYYIDEISKENYENNGDLAHVYIYNCHTANNKQYTFRVYMFYSGPSKGIVFIIFKRVSDGVTLYFDIDEIIDTETGRHLIEK